MEFSFSSTPTSADKSGPAISKGASLAEQTYNYLKEQIVSLELEPGEQLLENAVARQLGISRSPVREAFANLESNGFIESIPWHGARVTKITAQYITELYQVRTALETSAARLATDHVASEDLRGVRAEMEELAPRLEQNPNLFYEVHEVPFHNLFVLSCGNSLLQNMILSMQDHMRRIRNYLTYVQVPGHVDASFAEHVAIIDALLDRDAEAAEVAVRVHLENVLERVVLNLPSELQEEAEAD